MSEFMYSHATKFWGRNLPRRLKTALCLVFLFLSGVVVAQNSEGQAGKMLNAIEHGFAFEKNEGQLSNTVLYQAKDVQATYGFEKDGFRMAVVDQEGANYFNYRVGFLGKNDASLPVGKGRAVDRSRGKVNYYVEGRGMIQDVPLNRLLVYPALWDRIDAKFYQGDQGLKYDFVVYPGGDPNQIRLTLEGVDNVHLTGDGELAYTTPFGELRKGKPYTYQLIDGEQVEVSCTYHLEDGAISFELGDYDPDKTLIIDPVALKYATILGEGTSTYVVRHSAYHDGKLYMTGATSGSVPFGFSIDNQLGDPGSLNPSTSMLHPFLTCMKADGSEILWHTVFNFAGDASGHTVAVNSLGEPFLLLFSRDSKMGFDPLVDGVIMDATIAHIPPWNSASNSKYYGLVRLNSMGNTVKYFTYIQPNNTPGQSWYMRDEYGNFGWNYRFPMKVLDENKVYFSLPWRKYQHNSEPTDPMLPLGTNYYYNIQDKASNSGYATSVHAINTAVPGQEGLLDAAYIEGLYVTNIDMDAAKNVYLSGFNGGLSTYDFYTSFPFDNPTAVNQSNTWTQVVIKMDPDMDNILFGSRVYPELQQLGNSNAVEYFDNSYSGEDMTVDSAGNIYVSDGMVGYLSNPLSAFDAKNNLKWPAKKVNWIMDPISALNDNSYYAFYYVLKMPVENYNQYEWVNMFDGSGFYNGSRIRVGKDGTLHLLHMSDENYSPRPSFSTPGALVSYDRYPTIAPFVEDYWSYVRMNNQGDVLYATPLDYGLIGEATSEITGVNMTIDPETNTAYTVLLNKISSGHTYPVTPSYRDSDTDQQVHVLLNETPGPAYKTRLLVFDEPELKLNLIDTFSDGADEFCEGALIGFGETASAIGGNKPEYLSGDGSDPTHSLPSIYYSGIPFDHPNPAGEVNYQWQISADMGTTWENIPGGTRQNLKPKPISEAGTYQYRRLVISSGDTLISNTSTIQVNPGAFTLNITGPASTIYYCPSTAEDLGISVSGGNGTISWAWYNGSTPLDTGIVYPISGSGAPSSFSASIDTGITAADGGFYRLIVTDVASGCKKEFFVTLAPLTEKIYGQDTVSFCPGDTVFRLGPSVVNPDFDFLIEGPGGSIFNLPNISVGVADTGGYTLKVRENMVDTGYCINGATSVFIKSPIAHNPVFGALTDKGFCSTDAPASIGIDAAKPSGYTIQWSPGNYSSVPTSGLDNPNGMNPNFGPIVLPPGGFPASDIEYTMRATRITDGCFVTNRLVVRDTFVPELNFGFDEGDVLQRNGCAASSVSISNKATQGFYFRWEVVSTTFPGGKAALLASPDFGFNTYGDTIGTTKGMTLFYPEGSYNIKLGFTTSFYPIDSCTCEEYGEYSYSFVCGGGGGFTCQEFSANEDFEGATGFCADTLALNGQASSSFVSLKWNVLTVDSVLQLPGAAPKGIFYDSSGVLKPLSGQATIQPSAVIAIINSDTWGYPNANVVDYKYEAVYYNATTQQSSTCRDTVRVFSQNIIPDFSLVGDITACLFDTSTTSVTFTNQMPYTMQASDYSVMPISAPGVQYFWRGVGGDTSSIVNRNTLYPTFIPGDTVRYNLLVKDSLTGCSESASFSLNVRSMVMSAGDTLADCPGSEVQLEGTGQTYMSYSWNPSTGLYFPNDTIPNSTVLNPYLLFPATNATLVLTATDNVSGCVAVDTVRLIPDSSPPPAISDASFGSCGGKVVTIGPSIYTPDDSYTYSWTAGAGSDLGLLSDPTILNPTISLPIGFTDSLTYTLTITRGSCGSVSADFTIKDLNPGLNLDENFTLSSCGAPLTVIGSGLPSLMGYTTRWVPFSNLFTDATGTTAYTGGSETTVYPNPPASTDYFFTATHDASGCRYIDKITVNPATGFEVDAGEDKVYCHGGAATQLGAVATGGTIEWTAIGYDTDPLLGGNTTPDATIEASMLSWLSSTSAPVVTFQQATLTPGTYKYQVAVDPSGCNLVDEVVVKVYPLVLDGLGGDNVVVCEGVPFQLGVSPSPVGYTYFWERVAPQGGFFVIDDASLARPTITVNEKSTFQLTYLHTQSGCELTDFVAVSVAPTPTIAVTQPAVFCAAEYSLDVTSYITDYDSLPRKEWYQNQYPSSQITAPSSVAEGVSKNYILRTTNDFGCWDTAMVSLEFEIPEQPIVLSPYTIEAGVSSVSLDSFVPGDPSILGGMFSWHNADTAYAGSELSSTDVGKGTYYLFETSPNGCVSEAGVLEIRALPPYLTASLDPDSFSVFVKGSLIITITNPDGSGSATGLGYSGSLPSGLTIASGAQLNDCGGTLTATVGDSTVTLAGASVGPDTSCTVTIPIEGTVSGDYPLSGDQFTPTGDLRKSTIADTTLIITSGDYDGDGIDDATENTNGSDPLDPCDPPQMVGYTGYVASNMIWSEADCDGDSLKNGDEPLYFADPYIDDYDGDGVKDGKEAADLTFPTDPCDPAQNPGYTGYVDTNLIWRAADCDGDSVLNGVEDSLGIDPYNPDTDGDGVGDSTEVADMYDGLDPCDPAQDPGYTGYVDTSTVWLTADCDGDMLLNGVEDSVSTDPYNADTDGDGVPDNIEFADSTNPNDNCSFILSSQSLTPDSLWNVGDCDMDSLSNSGELTAGTELFNPDTDGDGVKDGMEVSGMNDPLDPCDPEQPAGYTGYVDTSSIWRADDCDGDMLLNGVEDSVGTDPYSADADGDGVPDGVELADSTNPNDPCDYVPASQSLPTDSTFSAQDCDMDGLPNDEELIAGTNPKNPDTDGDGVLDGPEVDSSYAPLDPCDPAQDAGYTGYVDTNSIWQAADCDMDMILNGVEDSLGSDPYDIDPDMELYGNEVLIPPGDSSLLDSNLTYFGSRFVNSVKRHRFLIKNVVPDANGPLTTGPIVTVTGGDGMFTVEFDQDCEILPTGEAYLIIKYQPTAEGCHTATISIPHNDADKPNPYSFKVQGKTKNAMCE